MLQWEPTIIYPCLVHVYVQRSRLFELQRRNGLVHIACMRQLFHGNLLRFHSDLSKVTRVCTVIWFVNGWLYNDIQFPQFFLGSPCTCMCNILCCTRPFILLNSQWAWVRGLYGDHPMNWQHLIFVILSVRVVRATTRFIQAVLINFAGIPASPICWSLRLETRQSGFGMSEVREPLCHN